MNLFNLQSEPSFAEGQTAAPGSHAFPLQGEAYATDGGTPRMVIRGESSLEGAFPDSGESYQFVTNGTHGQVLAHPLPKPDGVAYAAITDYLNCTFPFDSSKLPIFFSQLFHCLGERFAPATDRDRGLHGYNYSYSLGRSSALFAYGGQAGTGFLSLPGEACHLVPDWNALIGLLRDRLDGHITRWDGAVDDFHGTHSVDYAVELYMSGMFNAGGKPPSCNQRGNWLQPDGSGRTLYIGKRKNGKMLRAYEKGMQLGARWHPWVRWEVELHNVDRVIPWDVLLEPGKYVAGAYPKALGWVQDEMQRIRTIKQTGKLSYDFLTHFASTAYGKHINVMLAVEGSPEKVLEKLKRDGIPARLDTPSLTALGGV